MAGGAKAARGGPGEAEAREWVRSETHMHPPLTSASASVSFYCSTFHVAAAPLAMPSVTSTTHTATPGSLSLKASTGNLSMSSSVPSTPSTASPSASFTQSNSTLASLRGLYPRAARAFLQRNVALTHSLLTAAFALIEPPPQPAYPHGASSGVDALASQRRKWEILRVTFETTLYAAPPATEDPDELPAPLRANLLLSPEPFIATLHNRSLQLFMPASAGKPNSSCLPAQVLVTLALAGLKLGCTAVARAMIEDWLARRPQYAEAGKEEREGYAKVLELYCLHVLPRLEDWDYAEDFLQYERELAPDARKVSTSVHDFRSGFLPVCFVQALDS